MMTNALLGDTSCSIVPADIKLDHKRVLLHIFMLFDLAVKKPSEGGSHPGPFCGAA